MQLFAGRGRCRPVWMALGAVVAFGSAASAQIRITEYMYTPGDGGGEEYIEFTNIGDLPIDMTDWSYDDESGTPGEFDLSDYGVVQPGESVILTQDTEANFRVDWALPPTVKIIGNLGNPNGGNLNRNDAIYIFNQDEELVDVIDFGDQEFPGSIRTAGISGWVCEQALGLNDPYGWVLSAPGDEQASYASLVENVGNPGTHVNFMCAPAPTGACCEGGVCNLRTESACTGLGLYQGDGTTCEDVTCPAPSGAMVRITEFMHGGNGLEFMEFTNLGATAVDMSGWSYSDETRVPGFVDLSAFGLVDPGESVVLAEAEAGAFIADWSLSGVTVIGGNAVNISFDDEVNLYDDSGALVDRINFGTAEFPGSVDAEGRSAWPCAGAVGLDDIFNWRTSTVGDAQSSYAAASGDVGSPGAYVDVTCGPGSCCVEGVCSVLSSTDCIFAGGLFQGDNTNCTDDPCPAPSNAVIRITEYMYGGFGGEFLELTNLDVDPVDMDGWSFSDAGIPGSYDLSGFGTVQPGESVIMTNVPASVFRNDWNLLPSQKVVSIGSSELGRNDIIVVYDVSGSAVDTLQYGDEDYPGSIRTNAVSGWPCENVVGTNNIYGWTLSSIGDEQGSYVAFIGDIGNPGLYTDVVCAPQLTVTADDRYDVNGTVQSCTADGDCFGISVCRDGSCYAPVNRHLGIKPQTDAGGNVTYRVSLDTGVAGSVVLGFAGPPQTATAAGPGPNNYLYADIVGVGSAGYVDWGTQAAAGGEGYLLLTGCEIAPGNSYTVQAIAQGDDPTNEGNYSAPLALPTAGFGDATGGGEVNSPPNGSANLVDVFGAVLAFQNSQGGPKHWYDIEPAGVATNFIWNLADVFVFVQGFGGIPYPGTAPVDCP